MIGRTATLPDNTPSTGIRASLNQTMTPYSGNRYRKRTSRNFTLSVCFLLVVLPIFYDPRLTFHLCQPWGQANDRGTRNQILVSCRCNCLGRGFTARLECSFHESIELPDVNKFRG